MNRLNSREASAIQQRLGLKDVSLRKPYSLGAYNKFNDSEQWIRISQGCVHDCPFCYEPIELEVYPLPEIVRNHVKIMDMNLLCKKEALSIIRELGAKRVNEKIIYYELICGIDHRFLTEEMAYALKFHGFQNIRLAWDWHFKDQKKIKKAIDHLLKAGYKPNDLMIFMICNWRITYQENLKKLDLCKVWNVKVCDCYFDGQVFPKVIPLHWTSQENRDFRRKIRKHNQLVNFKIDPEVR